MKTIYFDNAATTRVDDEVLAIMSPYFNERYGNASSTHFAGQEAKNALEHSRKVIARAIGAKPHEIVFTSGGTEANNLAVKGLFYANYPQKNHIITTKIEHDCVLNACKWLETQGAVVTYLDVDSKGFVNLKELEDAITEKTFLVSIIHGNNEIGTIQDLGAIGKLCRGKGVLFHTDACQSFTKTLVNVRKQNLDLVTLNAHKIHGPKGVGALYIRDGVKVIPIAHGGGHERGLRSGTENVPGVVGFAKAVEVSNKRDVESMNKLRDKLIDGILRISNTRLNGATDEKRLCNNVNVSFNDIDGEAVGGYLENLGICTSVGSACASHTHSASHVLKAIGITKDQVSGSLRISISKYTTDEEVNYLLSNLSGIIAKLRR
jgi:cysteine desulfurase